MLCDRCKKREATTHYKQIINGDLQEYHLCNECAAEAGLSLGMDFGGFHKMFGSLFGSGLMGVPQVSSQRCPVCGMSADDIAQTGRVGCAECYETFLPRLMPSIQKIHGRTGHVGRVPRSAGQQLGRRREREELERKLRDAINREAFEEAASIRDQIKNLTEGGEGHDGTEMV